MGAQEREYVYTLEEVKSVALEIIKTSSSASWQVGSRTKEGYFIRFEDYANTIKKLQIGADFYRIRDLAILSDLYLVFCIDQTLPYLLDQYREQSAKVEYESHRIFSKVLEEFNSCVNAESSPARYLEVAREWGEEFGCLTETLDFEGELGEWFWVPIQEWLFEIKAIVRS